MMVSTNFIVSVRIASSELVVDRGKSLGIGLGAAEVPQLKPLRRPVLDQVEPFRVGHHAAHLRLEHGRLSQRACLGDPHQLRIGHARPEKVREP